MENIKDFKKYVKENGGVIIPVTNVYELIRFKVKNDTYVLYKNKKGIIKGNKPEAIKILISFTKGEKIAQLGGKENNKTPKSRRPKTMPAIPPVDYAGSIANWIISLTARGFMKSDEFYGDIYIPVKTYCEILSECEE